MLLAEVLDALDYSQSPFYLKTEQSSDPAVASLFRAAYSAGVNGIYVFQSSDGKDTTFSVKPAVYVAEAQTAEEARSIHRKLWNLGQAPFLIVILPEHIRVYTGFDYSQKDDRAGIIEPEIALNRHSILEILNDFCAEAIDNGQLWRKRVQCLKPEKRVDQRLLKNLRMLGTFLRERMGLQAKIAHTLIGKYVYIRYLRDREILSDQWLEQHDIHIDNVLGRNATIYGLRHLCTILDDRLNGSIFPLDFAAANAPQDEHVKWVASIFEGDEQFTHGRQVGFSTDFRAYDFAYIPIELLSSIYEQFLHAEGKGQKVGAYYTPEYLAEYLIAEVNSVMPVHEMSAFKPLHEVISSRSLHEVNSVTRRLEGMKILDPSCGSGIFLVLIYAYMIEMRLVQLEASTLPLSELLEILSFIYGIERELDACYVAEFSLILILLQYADISALLQDTSARLPSLHNTHIFQCDFFDDSSPIWVKGMKFDLIIGNPPWISADGSKEPLAATWIDVHHKSRPVDNESIAEAFSWRVLDLLKPEGYVGLVLPAALLYNLDARMYRRAFFEFCEVRRMTNFSNLRKELFEGRAIAPAITVIYQLAKTEQERLPIEHYGPFALHQIASYGKIWAITMNEYECQRVSPYDAASGDSATWKFALWGTHRDRRAIARLRKAFPQTLGQLCQARNAWYLYEGPQLRNVLTEDANTVKHIPALYGKKRLNTRALNKSGRLFSIPENVLEDIPSEECYIRKRGGEKGLLISEPPHIVMNAGWKYSIYSNEYFVIKPRQIGLSVPEHDADLLRALSIFLRCNVVNYYLFFLSPQWGIERDVITLDAVKNIPLPAFTGEQIAQLGILQQELVSLEHEQGPALAQAYLDQQMLRILHIPENIGILANEFLQIRSKLVGGGTRNAVEMVLQYADHKTLQAYAQQLTNDLDGFLDSHKLHHRISIEQGVDLICCTVEFVQSDRAFTPFIKDVSSQNGHIFSRLQESIKQRFSQWIYIQRSLKVFGPSSISLYKVPHLINWTRTQAMNDADDMVTEILSRRR
jgi:hypothetical protein